jgi:uncharacterized protein YjbI with pentapeptide repeats
MATPAQKRLIQKRLADIRKAHNVRFKWPKWTGFSGMTLRDWIGAMATPLTILIAIAGLLWGVYQFNTQQLDNAKTQSMQELDNTAQSLDQQRQTILDTYFDRMQELLLAKPDDFKASNPGDQYQALAQARTYSALRSLDGARKGTLIRYLWAAKLIDGPQPIISMLEADLSGAMFFNADLSGINLSGADLVNSDLSSASLIGANLSSASLIDADLRSADLSGADLLLTDLGGAGFDSAKLCGAYIGGFNPNPMPGTVGGQGGAGPPDMTDTDLSCAHLYPNGLAGANLRGAPLEGAYLRGADLHGASLIGADLSGAVLSEANLRDATVTREQLAKAKSLKGATMPDGSIHP